MASEDFVNQHLAIG